MTETFHVHRELLVAKSAYLSRALEKDGFKESIEGRIQLVDETSTAFKLFLSWLYTDTVRTPSKDAEAEELVLVYVMADKMCLEKLQNQVVDALARHFQGNWISARVLRLGQHSGSSARSFAPSK